MNKEMGELIILFHKNVTEWISKTNKMRVIKWFYSDLVNEPDSGWRYVYKSRN